MEEVKKAVSEDLFDFKLAQRLAKGWTGDLEHALPVAARLKNPRYMLDALSILGADLRFFRDMALHQLQLDIARESLQTLKNVEQQQERRRTAFIKLLVNDTTEDGAKPIERIAHKGLLLACLEKSNTFAGDALIAIKRGLILDYRAALSGNDFRTAMLGELNALASGEVVLIWTSSLGHKYHAVDVIIEKDGSDYTLTTLNRGDGALAVEGSPDHAGARCSRWADQASLLNALQSAFEERSTWTTMKPYHEMLHPDGDKANDLYRPQRRQKANNCPTKSMMAAVNYLMTGPGCNAATADYKEVRPRLLGYLVGHSVDPTVVAHVRDHIKNREDKRLKRSGVDNIFHRMDKTDAFNKTGPESEIWKNWFSSKRN